MICILVPGQCWRKWSSMIAMKLVYLTHTEQDMGKVFIDPGLLAHTLRKLAKLTRTCHLCTSPITLNHSVNPQFGASVLR